MNRILDGYCRLLEVLLVVMQAGMVVLVFGNVFMRYALNSGIAILEEFLVAAAMVSAWLITVAEIPARMVSMLEPFISSPTLLLIVIMVLVLVMAVGTAMDMTPTILILTPS